MNGYGPRLKALRLERGLTQADASRMLGLNHRQSLASIETGARDLSADELIRAARGYGVELAHFSDPCVVAGEARFCWRRSPASGAGDVADAEMRVGRMFGAYRHVLREIGLPPRRISYATGLNKASTEAEAAAAGEALSDEMAPARGGTLSTAEAIGEGLEVPILAVDLPRGLSGTACRLDDMDGIVVNRGEVAGRRNSNIAHELFHILTWDEMPPRHVECERADPDVGRRREARPRAGVQASAGKNHGEGSPDGATGPHEEALADAFASGLLMPLTRVDELLGRVDLRGDAANLARRLNGAASALGVTSMALATRLKRLGRLDGASFASLKQSRRLAFNGSPRKPAAPPAFSRSFLEVLFCGVEGGLLPMEAAEDVTGLSAAALMELRRHHGLDSEAAAGSGGWDVMRQRISSWSKYRDGWDGGGSVAPLPSTLQHAMDFTASAKASGIALPKLGLYGDGEVDLRWSRGRAAASVALLSDGHIVAYVRLSTRELACELDEHFAGADQLTNLLAALRAHF